MDDSKFKIIYLIDFFSHTSLNSRVQTDFRFAQLLECIMCPEVDYRKRFIVSMSGHKKSQDFPIHNSYREKFYEIKNLAEMRGWKWLEILDDKLMTVNEFERQISKKLKIKISNENTDIIFGGVNTSGCVFETMQTSLIKFLEAKYKTIMHLPFCAEAQMHGSSDCEKNLRAYVYIFSRLKELNCTTDQLELTQYITQLKL